MENQHHLLTKRDDYHDGHCESTGLEIFAFLLFLVYLLDFLRNVLMNAMLNIMINDETVTAVQGKLRLTTLSSNKKILTILLKIGFKFSLPCKKMSI